MKQAVKGASKWLIEHTKRNPIPFKLFKSILDKQIEWAKNNRGITFCNFAYSFFFFSCDNGDSSNKEVDDMNTRGWKHNVRGR